VLSLMAAGNILLCWTHPGRLFLRTARTNMQPTTACQSLSILSHDSPLLRLALLGHFWLIFIGFSDAQRHLAFFETLG
jgi:hypothetical protein